MSVQAIFGGNCSRAGPAVSVTHRIGSNHMTVLREAAGRPVMGSPYLAAYLKSPLRPSFRLHLSLSPAISAKPGDRAPDVAETSSPVCSPGWVRMPQYRMS